MMGRLLTRLLGLAFLAVVMILPASEAQAAVSVGMPRTPLAALLAPDGSLKLNAGFSDKSLTKP